MTVPEDLKDADALLDRYGRWAQDRYKKQTCASAERYYIIPKWEGEETMESFMPDFNAMQVQATLQSVPFSYRRVLFAHYVPKRLPPDAQRRRMGVSAVLWEQSLLSGLRIFWNLWRQR